MSLVTVASLAARLGVPVTTPRLQGSLDAAEAKVAAYIGASTLARRTQSEIFAPVRDRESIEVNKGPLTELTSVTVDGSAVTIADLRLMWWGFAWADPTRRFAMGRMVVVSYFSGWLNEASLPAGILEAILQASQEVYSTDASGRLKTSERIGDWAASWDALSKAALNTTLSVSVTGPLVEYRRPFPV